MILPILKKYKAKQYTSFFVDYGWGGGGILQVIIYHVLHVKRLVKKG